MRLARTVMVCGAASGASKSFLATALARWYARLGLKVAPFKRAEHEQQRARRRRWRNRQCAVFQGARRAPAMRVNPVLLKPERDTVSQVILLGQRNDVLSRMNWRSRSAHLWPVIRESLPRRRRPRL